MRLRNFMWGSILLLAAGCSVQAGGKHPAAPLFVRRAHVREPMLTCMQATHAAHQALARMGYSVTSVERPQPGAPGKVVGRRDTGWAPRYPEAGTVYTVTVGITCSDAGAEFDAVTNEGVAAQLLFPHNFAAALKRVVRRQPVRPQLAGEEPQGLIVNVEPQRSRAARSDFGLDLPAAGITPVKFEVINRTKRRYHFQRDGVELVTVQGKRETPLPLQKAAARLTPSGDAGKTEALLQQKQIKDASIQPGGSLRGYLYFTASAYHRARVVLTDIDSDESEGFSVAF